MKKFLLLFVIVILVLVQGSSSAEGPESTPESCFEFSDGEITNYYGGGDGCGKNVVIPRSIGGETVTRIGETSFYFKRIQSVVIPDSVIT